MDKTTQSVIDKTVSFLNEPAELTQLSAQLFNNGVMPWNMAKLEKFAVEFLHSQSQTAMFLIGDSEGNFILSKPEPGGSTATKFVNRAVKPTLTTWRYWNKSLRLLRTETNITDTYDPRSRPWYQGAEKKKGLYWTDLFIYYTGNKPGIAVSCPILDSQGKVVGVIGCDIELVELSHFLQSLKIGKNGLAFIINDKQELVAYPDPAKVIAKDKSGNLQPVRVENMDNASIAAAYREYLQTKKEKVAVAVAGERYRASFTNFPADFGKPWQVAIVVPENDFIGKVKDLTRRVFFICLFFLAISVLMAILIARRISKPILGLATETDHIRNFILDKPFELKSHISEIEILSQAINRMKVSLRSFMRFAPEQLVQEVVLEGKELMLGGDRREVTLLFSDLRNFTHFAEVTRPEDVVQILNVHFDAMVRIISDHGGYVVDFLGDSLFAVFGAPQNIPDHAFQAIKCALTLQLTRQKLNDELASPHLPRLEMGIGINTGSCVVGNMGSQMRIKYGVVGHAVNLAARIETFTAGGQILISEASRAAV
jgi:adenylate cyclase